MADQFRGAYRGTEPPKTGINLNSHPTPIQLVSLVRVMTKDSHSGHSYHLGIYEAWDFKDAFQNAERRAERNGLPIWEIGPRDNPDKIIPRSPDGNFIVHVVKRNFGEVDRDAEQIDRMYTSAQMLRVKRNAPPIDE